jgi:hypothetical protein
MNHVLRLGLFFAGVSFVLGCSGGNPLKTTVTGKVTYKGQPVDSGLVSFFNPADGTPYQQVNIDKGTYIVTNIPSGDVIITVDCTPMNDGAAILARGEKLPTNVKSIVPDAVNKKYAAAATSPFKKTIGRSKTETIDLDLQ